MARRLVDITDDEYAGHASMGGTGGVGSYGIVSSAWAATINCCAAQIKRSMLALSSAVLGVISLYWYARSPMLPEICAMLFVMDANWLMVFIGIVPRLRSQSEEILTS